MVATKIRKTYVARPSELHPAWRVIDAAGKPLGRLATEVATLLQGKHRPIYTPTLITGDFVVVVNAAKIAFTGRKLLQKEYHFHTGYPGGLRTVSLERMMERNPARVVEIAVQGMLPKTGLGRRMLKRMKVYAGPNHPHQAQVKGSAAVSLEKVGQPSHEGQRGGVQ